MRWLIWSYTVRIWHIRNVVCGAERNRKSENWCTLFYERYRAFAVPFGLDTSIVYIAQVTYLRRHCFSTHTGAIYMEILSWNDYFKKRHNS